LITALPLIGDLKGLFFSEGRMDKEAGAASGFEHRTMAGVLWQKGSLRFAARSQANSGPVRVGKEPHFHLRSIAPKRRDVPRLRARRRGTGGLAAQELYISV
jgi:hypothetical protein